MGSVKDEKLLANPQTENGVVVKKDSPVSKSNSSTGAVPVQPDGGWGWVVCFTSMACNGTVFGIINCFGILYAAMLDHYAKGDPNISFKTGMLFLIKIIIIGSVCLGLHQCHFYKLFVSVGCYTYCRSLYRSQDMAGNPGESVN